MINKVVLVGRLTRDPELKYTTNNVAVATFTLAVQRRFQNNAGEREADFISIVVWNKQAENTKQYVFQGSLIGVDGRMQSRTYDAADGTKRYVTEVVAENITFLDTKKQNQGQAPSYDNSYSSNQPKQNYTKQPSRNDVTLEDPFKDFDASGIIDISDDDLPF